MLTIVIPAYNEQAIIKRVIERIFEQSYSFIKEVIVVDDGSSDKTGDIAASAGARVLKHNRNKGYGAALKSGIKSADSLYVMTFDADGQHRVSDIECLWNHRDENDMVVGARQGLMHSKIWRMPGKWLLHYIACYLGRFKIPDLNSGLRLFRRDIILKYLHICPNGFSFSTTSTMAMLARSYRVQYVPIRVNKRTGKSTVSIKTGFRTLLLILRITTLFGPLRMFIPLSFIMFLIGLFWGVPIIYHGEGVSVGALLAMLTGVNLFMLGLLGDQISQLRLERFE